MKSRNLNYVFSIANCNHSYCACGVKSNHIDHEDYAKLNIERKAHNTVCDYLFGMIYVNVVESKLIIIMGYKN